MEQVSRREACIVPSSFPQAASLALQVRLSLGPRGAGPAFLQQLRSEPRVHWALDPVSAPLMQAAGPLMPVPPSCMCPPNH